MDYQVELESFRGPLDLLLYLVKRDEVDLCDILLARLAEQFIAYLNVQKTIDVEWAGEFMVMAATLTEMKSRLVLPRNEELPTEEADPRLQLVKQLIEYKKFKDAAKILDEQAEQQMLRLARLPVEPPPGKTPSEQPIRKVELWDLVSAFGRLLGETITLQPQQISMDETPIHVHMERILARLRDQPHLTFAALFTPPYTRGRLLGLFLAILELIKGRLIHAEQPELFGDITVRLAPEMSQDEAAFPQEQPLAATAVELAPESSPTTEGVESAHPVDQ